MGLARGSESVDEARAGAWLRSNLIFDPAAWTGRARNCSASEDPRGGQARRGVVQLTPSSGAADDWTYAVDFVVNSTGTVGTPSVMDVDNDGYPELFIPHYKEGHLDMHTWKPETVVV